MSTTRRQLLSSFSALGGILLTGCSRDVLLPPKLRGGLIGLADILTMTTNRLLLADQPLAREFEAKDIATEFPTWGQTNPENEDYQRDRRQGFTDYRLSVSGLVAQPRELSLDDIRRLPSRTQITAHVCEQGWSAIAEWTGVPLLKLLEAAGGVQPGARYAFMETVDGWYESIDMFDVVHPQTIVAYGLNGRDLPVGNGAPLRLRVERQCGYKNLKFLKSIQMVDSVAPFHKGTGGLSSDYGFHWYAGV